MPERPTTPDVQPRSAPSDLYAASLGYYLSFELGDDVATRLLPDQPDCEVESAPASLSIDDAARILEEADLDLAGFFLHCQIFALRTWTPGVPPSWSQADWWWSDCE